MNQLEKVATTKKFSVVHLKGLKHDLKDDKGKTVIKRGENGVAVIDPKSGHMAIMTEKQFDKFKNPSAIRRVINNTAKRALQGFNLVHLKVPGLPIQIGLAPLSLSAAIMGAFVGTVEGTFSAIKSKISSMKKEGSQMIKLAKKSKVEEESEDVQEEARELGRTLAKRKKGKVSKKKVLKEKEDVDEAQDDLGKALHKKMKKKAWARIKTLPEHATIGPDYNQGVIFRMLRREERARA